MSATEVASLEVERAAEPSLPPLEPPPGPRLEPKVRARAPRLANVERLRLVAMFEIVAFHVSGAFGHNSRLPWVAGLGLPSFLLLNNVFNCTLVEKMGARPFMQVKLSRLLVPWLVWSLVYLVVGMLERLRHGEELMADVSLWMLVGGTYDHLWFVPFALFGSLLVVGLQAKTRAWAAPGAVWGALAAGLGLLGVCALILATRPIEWPALQWLFALPSPLLGFALGRAVLEADGKLLKRVGVVATPLAVAALAVARVEPEIEMLRRYLVSLALVTLAFIWPGEPDRFSTRLTPMLFGIYLLHPLFVRIYQGVHIPEIPLVVLSASVFALAALTVKFLGRTRLRALV